MPHSPHAVLRTLHPPGEAAPDALFVPAQTYRPARKRFAIYRTILVDAPTIKHTYFPDKAKPIYSTAEYTLCTIWLRSYWQWHAIPASDNPTLLSAIRKMPAAVKRILSIEEPKPVEVKTRSLFLVRFILRTLAYPKIDPAYTVLSVATEDIAYRFAWWPTRIFNEAPRIKSGQNPKQQNEMYVPMVEPCRARWRWLVPYWLSVAHATDRGSRALERSGIPRGLPRL